MITVNYNVKEHVIALLDSIYQTINDLSVEIFVVDNASVDGACHAIPHRFPNIHFIQNEENIGFGKANNQAIKQARGNYTLIINPDCVVKPGAIHAMIRFLDSQPKYVACGPRLENENGVFAPESRRYVPTLIGAGKHLLGFGKNDGSKTYYVSGDSTQSTDVEALSGACMLIRTEALKKINGFDERFFMYAEDIDLCLRLRQGEKRIRYIPDAIVVHKKGASTRKDSLAYSKQFYKAIFQFFDKHYGTSHLRPLKLFIYAFLGMKTVISFFQQNLNRSKEILGDLVLFNIIMTLAFVLRFFIKSDELSFSVYFLGLNVLSSILFLLSYLLFTPREEARSAAALLRSYALAFLLVTSISFYAKSIAFSRLVLGITFSVAPLVSLTKGLFNATSVKNRPNEEKDSVLIVHSAEFDSKSRLEKEVEKSCAYGLLQASPKPHFPEKYVGHIAQAFRYCTYFNVESVRISPTALSGIDFVTQLAFEAHHIRIKVLDAEGVLMSPSPFYSPTSQALRGVFSFCSACLSFICSPILMLYCLLLGRFSAFVSLVKAWPDLFLLRRSLLGWNIKSETNQIELSQSGVFDLGILNNEEHPSRTYLEEYSPWWELALFWAILLGFYKR